MKLLCHAITRLLEVAGAAMVSAFTIAILLDVVCRYLLRIPVSWVSEFTVLLFQFTAFLGAALALRRGLHFGLGLVVLDYMPRMARVVTIVTAIAVVGASLLVSVLAVKIAQQTWRSSYATLGISHAWLYVVMSASGAIMVLFGLEQLIAGLQGKSSIHTTKEPIA